MLGCLDVRIESFDKKYTVLAEGGKAKYVGVVLSGRVQVSRIDYFSNRSLLANIGPGELFGEAFACAEVQELPVTVTATEKSEIMLIEARRILHTCSNNCSFHNSLIYNLMKDLAMKTISFHKRLEITSRRTTRDKLMAYLSLMAKEKRSSTFEIPFDRQELADYLEVDRSGLSSEIGKLKKEGIIEADKKFFTLIEDYI